MPRVGLFIRCYMDAFEAEVGIATLELLERLGCTVDYPFDQSCCGQPLLNGLEQERHWTVVSSFRSEMDIFGGFPI